MAKSAKSSTYKPLAKFQTACMKGVESAFKKHHLFTGGYALRQAPEGFIQGEVACALSKIARFVTLESSVQMLLVEAGAELRGKKPRTGRVDLAVWWANGTPRFVIEIKKVYAHDSISADAKRLRQVIGRGGTSREGIVVVYSDAAKRETLTTRFAKVASKSRTKASTTSKIFSYCDEAGNERFWQAACFVVKAT
ncbi:hypothetical protein [Luteimonas fraxinea]|uniref:PD-(D/E)XK nuclease superfamily protein n=1 Tax=Luteimonas fraxinea TaxID=2901869 RepID=A0ABS8UCJ9_9GAMM|nr:hypothetical protein [Luteimonas fraxinea]MCD9096697.1 hypothetical protein [Luteimonas fraxinea]MCD9126066.1 hypothetical protein [Luteimonas fraxinea]